MSGVVIASSANLGNYVKVSPPIKLDFVCEFLEHDPEEIRKFSTNPSKLTSNNLMAAAKRIARNFFKKIKDELIGGEFLDSHFLA